MYTNLSLLFLISYSREEADGQNYQFCGGSRTTSLGSSRKYKCYWYQVVMVDPAVVRFPRKEIGAHTTIHLAV